MSIVFQDVHFSYEQGDKPVFSGLSIDLAPGITSLVGQNGTGKTTFMLLAGGRLYPSSGKIFIQGKDSLSFRSEEERNLTASFVYQNMEFQTEEPVKELLEIVFQNGNHSSGSYNLVEELIHVFGLEPVLDRPVQSVSKGEMQKILIAFSLLYGSEILLLDEPVFALENRWKEIVLEYLKDYASGRNFSLIYSIHELDLSKRYSDQTLLFHKDHSISYGRTEAVLTKDIVEQAYQVPLELLYKREGLYREHLTNPDVFKDNKTDLGTVKTL